MRTTTSLCGAPLWPHDSPRLRGKHPVRTPGASRLTRRPALRCLRRVQYGECYFEVGKERAGRRCSAHASREPNPRCTRQDTPASCLHTPISPTCPLPQTSCSSRARTRWPTRSRSSRANSARSGRRSPDSRSSYTHASEATSTWKKTEDHSLAVTREQACSVGTITCTCLAIPRPVVLGGCRAPVRLWLSTCDVRRGVYDVHRGLCGVPRALTVFLRLSCQHICMYYCAKRREPPPPTPPRPTHTRQ